MVQRFRSHAIGNETMKISFHKFVLQLLLLLLSGFCTAFISSALALNTVPNINLIHERGQSVPPFLNPGVKANLLLLIDNSGSMLDMAYSGNNDYCYDSADTRYDSKNNVMSVGTFDSTKSYTGYFDENSWYKWDTSGTTFWKPSTTYNHGDLVYDNGILYQAQCTGGAGSTCSSGTTSLLDDTTVTWNAIKGGSGFSNWQASTSYANGTLVYDNNIMYQAECFTGPNSASSCSSGAASLVADNSTVTTIWHDKGHPSGWEASATYSTGDFIYESSSGIVYQATCAGAAATCTSGSDSIDDDNAGTVISWQAIGGTWQAATDYANESYAYSTSDSTLYQVECLQGDSNATSCTSGSTPAADNGTTGMSWHTKTDGDFVVVTDGNQCSGAEYSNANVCIKTDETSTPKGVTTFAATGKFLNWLSASKFDIEKKILTGGKYNTDASLLISEHRGCAGSPFLKDVSVSNGTDTKILSFMVRGPISDNDLEYKNDKISAKDNTARIAILGVTNSSIFNENCKYAVDGILAGENLNSLSNKINSCLTPLRTAEDPALTDQRPMLNHALQFCEKYFDPDNTDRNLNAAVNECTKLYNEYPPSEISPYYGAYACYGIYDSTLAHTARTGYIGRCWNPGASGGTCTPKQAAANCTLATGATSCTYEVGGQLYRNYRATTSSTAYNYQCNNLKNNSSPLDCQNDNSWTLLYTDGTTTFSEPTCGAAAGTAAGWVPANPDTNPTTDDPNNCVQQAMYDYCGSLSIPEVIDPSDQASTTSEFWNTPATLIDSGIVVAMGTDRPLAVMKGLIKQSTIPSGVLQRKAEELRIGAMKFNSVGADYECSLASDTSKIEKFCPAANEDGSRLVSPIQLGGSFENNGKKHIENVAEAINLVQADTWTPLAEAVFSALGYLTQRSDMCINKDGSGNCLDFPISTTDDPVLESCQPNHLLIITEGSSTADIDSQVADFAINHYDGIGGDTTTTAGTCTNGLQGSTYLDDLTAFGYYNKPQREAFASDADFDTAYIAAEIEARELYTAANAYIDGDIKEGVFTHIITSGSLRDDGTNGECNPATLMENAALQGGPPNPNLPNGYISGENPTDFESGLTFIFESILERASAGSAASVISSSRTGEGAVYQAIFWPELNHEDGAGTNYSIKWAGEVHSMFIDSQGYLYEDTPDPQTLVSDGKLDPVKDIDGDTRQDVNEDIDGDGLLDINEHTAGIDADCDGKIEDAEDKDGDGHLDVAESAWTSTDPGLDKRVIIYYDSTLNKSMGCYQFEYSVSRDDATNTCTKSLACTKRVDLEDINFIWSAKNWLAGITDNDILTNRSDINNPADLNYISSTHKRNIFTWEDINNNGFVDSTNGQEIIPFEAGNWNINVVGARGSVAKDFGLLTDSDVDTIVKWVRGLDSPGFRGRQIPFTEGGTPVTWRLGDVINSTPMVVAAPEGNFHLSYNDRSFAKYVARHNKRRSVIYFGANDGMLHAVNGGFYNDKQNRFCLTQTCDNSSAPELGAELWAYVPYNLLPHLEFLADPAYVHKYYVDLRPRIFDVQIFTPEPICATAPTNQACIHPDGWGTILVGGMRLGGAPVHASELNSLASDNRVFASSYFVIDITDPEHPPELLGEITRTSEDKNFDHSLSPGEDDNGNTTIDHVGTDMGYSTSIPTVVVMKEGGAARDTIANRWYLMLGSGPHSYYTTTNPTGNRALKGFSDQNAKIAVLPLQRFTASNTPIRIPDAPPTEDDGGRFDLTLSPRGFVSDLVTLDFDIAPASSDYMDDAVYFGTIEANSDDVSGGFSYDVNGVARWAGGGKLYRLRTRNLSDSTTYSYLIQQEDRSFFSTSLQDITTPDEWVPTIFMDPGRPVSSGISASYDGANFWIYFGTGRFFDADDKSDDTQQAFYGIKEPMESATKDGYEINKLTWETMEFNGTKDAAPGYKGLLNVSEILVHEATNGYNAALSCRGGTTDCLPSPQLLSDPSTGTAYFDSLSGPSLMHYLAGTGDCTAPDYNNCADGWQKEFYEYGNRERNLGQAAILGGLVTFTTYQPYSEPCLAEGISNLYAVYYQTGTAWFENIFGQNGIDIFHNVKDKIELGRGMAVSPRIHVGRDEEGKVKAIIQTSTGEILEIEQTVPKTNYKTGLDSWIEYKK